MKKFDLETPCLVLDLDILEDNLGKMQAAADQAGKKLRPHAKTHKCSTLAKMQIEKGAVGVSVAKVSEAEGLVKAGVHDILITGAPAVESKVARVVALVRKAPTLMTVVDDASNIRLLERHLEREGLRMDVLLDIDVGSARTGAPAREALALAELVLAGERLRLRGVQAYAGHVQHIVRYDERKRASKESLGRAVEIFEELRAKEASCTIFSGAGTGTSEIDLSVPALTELQVGSYALMDAEYSAIEDAGSGELSARFRPALTLLTTVVNASHATHVTVDAGLKSLYRDGALPRVITPAFAGLRYDWFGDEYGKLSAGEGAAKLPRLGTALELVVSHCDPTVNLFDSFFVTRAGEVVDEWLIDLRGKSR